jgi:hypothetical protein
LRSNSAHDYVIFAQLKLGVISIELA